MPQQTPDRNVKRVLDGDDLYELTVIPEDDRWYWAVMKSSRSRTGWYLGVVHAGGEAQTEGGAWRQARAALPRRSRPRRGPSEMLALRVFPHQ